MPASSYSMMKGSEAVAVGVELEALYRTRFRAFLLTATAMLGDGDAALEVVQEAFAAALGKRRSFRGEGSVEAWLWPIVLNKARDRLRGRRNDAPLSGYDREERRAAEADEEVRAALRLLPERQRLVVFLRHYGDLSYDQIADALAISPGTVAASLNAAHAALRRRFEEVSR